MTGGFVVAGGRGPSPERVRWSRARGLRVGVGDGPREERTRERRGRGLSLRAGDGGRAPRMPALALGGRCLRGAGVSVCVWVSSCLLESVVCLMLNGEGFNLLT